MLDLRFYCKIHGSGCWTCDSIVKYLGLDVGNANLLLNPSLCGFKLQRPNERFQFQPIPTNLNQSERISTDLSHDDDDDDDDTDDAGSLAVYTIHLPRNINILNVSLKFSANMNNYEKSQRDDVRSQSQPIPTNLNQFQPISTNLNESQPISATMSDLSPNQFQPISTNSNQSQPI